MKYGHAYGVLLLIACGFAFSSGCIASDGEEAQVKSGDRVLVNYTGTFDNGTVFDTSTGREPLGFTVGQVLPATVTGISPGAVTIDANHPLAGEDLTFTVSLVEIG